MFYLFLSVYGINNSLIADSNTAPSSEGTALYTVEAEMNAYAIALRSGITFDELNAINGGTLQTEQVFQVGDKVTLPVTSPLMANVSTQAASTDLLPMLGGALVNSANENTNLVFNQTGLNNYVGGTTEENIANTLNKAATEDWSALSIEDIQTSIEEDAKAKLKNEATSKVTEVAQNLLGKFGKAEVSLSIDESGNLEGSSFKVLSPLYDQNENLLFSQVGVHGQGSGDDSRTIGNFGVGYRYEAEAWLAGANAFIDYDFTGNNTRLGLGAEYWQDNLKIASNVYTPLSGWKESDVMKNYEALIYDERAASGFDIRAKAYLPNYPQLGGSFVVEQYFGDEVALFSTDERQKDPYALTLGLNYSPIPLVTTELSHKVGKDSQTDTRVDLNLNLQLGTPIEQQLDPDNVGLARSLKGSRYDMVDRNYDIVFEYQQEDFAITLNGPTAALLESTVTITSSVKSRSDVQSYEWIITDKWGNPLKPAGIYTDSSVTFKVDDYIDHYVRLKVITERGYEAISEVLIINVSAEQSQSLLTIEDAKNAAQLIDFADVTPLAYWTLEALENKKRKNMVFTAFDTKGNPFDLTQNGGIEILWRSNGVAGEQFQPINSEDGLYIDFEATEQSNQYNLIAIADMTFIEKKGATREIDILVKSTNNSTVFATGTIIFIKFDETLSPLGIDPNNFIIQIVEIPKGRAFSPTSDIVSESGFFDGHAINTTWAPIKQGTTYEARILTGPNQNELKDVTDYYVDNLVWLYWDPLTRQEVSVLTETAGNVVYRGLEGCVSKSTYMTQRNNYSSNELAWGEILQADNQRTNKIVTEQGLRLSVQFDFTRINDPRTLNSGECVLDIPADELYIGFDDRKKKAEAWNEAK